MGVDNWWLAIYEPSIIFCGNAMIRGNSRLTIFLSGLDVPTTQHIQNNICQQFNSSRKNMLSDPSIILGCNACTDADSRRTIDLHGLDFLNGSNVSGWVGWCSNPTHPEKICFPNLCLWLVYFFWLECLDLVKFNTDIFSGWAGIFQQSNPTGAIFLMCWCAQNEYSQ